MRRVFLAGVVVMALLLSGPSLAAQGLPPKPVRLTMAVVAGGETKGLKAILPMWEKEMGVKVELVEFPYPTLYEKLVTAFQANAATYDLLIADDPWMPKFGAEGWLTPLDTEFGYKRDPDIFPVVYDLGTWPPPRGPVPPTEKGKARHLYAITLVGNVEFFMYRKDLVSAPRTWNDVIANAKKVHDPNKPLYGFVIRGAKGNPVISEFTPVLLSFGARIFDDNWKVILNSKEAVAALRFFTKDLKQYAPPGVANYDAAERAREVATGRAAQGFIWPAEITDIVENPSVSKVVGKMGYALAPAGSGGKRGPLIGNWLLAVPKASKNKRWAYEFILWATSAKVQKPYALGGGIPFRRSILTDSELNTKFAFFTAMAASLAAPAEWRPRTQEWFAVEAILGTHVNAALAGIETPENAIAKAAAEIEKHMREAGYYK
ncbi:MAG TPA: extracellular solute-binding protein [bacterium]|jgi:multiple sugar transport system substrate-binding protein|nr:extracellular solute-binding protein [bacterium]